MWIVAALESELSLLKRRLAAEFQGKLGGYPYYKGKIGSKDVRLGVTGIGISSACLALGAFISLEMPHMAVMVGTAGAMPDSGLKICDMVTAEAEILSELGQVTAPGIGDTKQLKMKSLSQEIDFDSLLTRSIYEAALSIGNVCLGKVLTVVGVSSQTSQARKRAEFFKAVAENMEGYGLALAGKHFGIKTSEIRGISNIAGDNDKSRWDFKGAREKAQMALLEYLKKTF